MVLLSVHQQNRSERDRLCFDPRCPACRHGGLLGLLAPELVFSRRVQALLASGVLALSVGATTSSVAAERDRQHEGVSAPEPSGPGRTDDFGSALGAETPLPFDVDPHPADPRSPEGQRAEEVPPLEPEPAHDPDVPPPLAEPGTPPPLIGHEAPMPPPAAQHEQSTEVVPKRMPLLVPDPTAAVGEPDARRPGHLRWAGGDRASAQRWSQGAGRSAAPPQPPPDTSVVAGLEQTAPPPRIAEVASGATARIPAGARFHVVRRGESLWSIATALLGPDAANADIARRVERLWSLNEHRIGTGNPDLLRIGVKLQLR